ncbi:PHA/PHB synthase family protein [Nocardia goodfellowii]
MTRTSLPDTPSLGLPQVDPRFADPAWKSYVALRLLHTSYRSVTALLVEAANVLPLARADRLVVRSLIQMANEAAAPPNFLLTNPTALRKAVQTRGRSVMAGARNFLSDVSHNRGLPALVDDEAFTVGEDLASTPGRVVFRNDLMELIQYEPRTPTVYSVPILFCPPWVNKFYIADLTPGRSLIEWTLDHGHTAFVISYRNPGPDQRRVGFDDYLCRALLPALEAIRDITGAEEVNLLGACLGGLMGFMLAAWLRDRDRPRIRSITALNSMTDFADITDITTSGAVGLFSRGLGIHLLERLSSNKGIMSGQNLEAFFRVLRANDLIWSYVKANWLMGQAPPAYDILYWNCDTLNVPHRAQQYLLRDLCLDNSFASGTAVLAGRPLRLDRIVQDVFLVAARDDHIIPWSSSYRTVASLPGDVRFYLASGGHIASVVTPPDSGASYWTNEESIPDAAKWLAGATRYHDTWWRAWARWLAERAGPQRTPPPTGSKRYPATDPAPGKYVFT